MKKLIIVAVLVCLTGPASAADANGNYTLLGAGTASCGSWTETRRTNGYFQHSGWVQGYLTAYNAMLPGVVDLTEGIDVAGIMGWMDNYCNKNPLNNMDDTAAALVKHLRSR
jgi:opacity protein-like surface antigen